MTRHYLVDILANMVAPLAGGTLLYSLRPYFPLPPVLRHHLADGLWAYAFLSAILIIWERRWNGWWLTLVVLTSVLFEACQFWALIPGTGDTLDVVTYCISFSIALLLNSVFKPNQTSHAIQKTST